MKITTTHDHQKLFDRAIRITQLEPLSEPQVVEKPLSVGKTLYVPMFLGLKPFDAPKQNVATETKTEEESSTKKVSLADVTKNFGIGTGFAAGSLGVIPLAKHTTESQLAAHLTNYGFAPEASNQMASSALGFARSNLGHLCCLFFAGSAITIGTVEALKPDWKWKRKLLFAALGGLVLLLIGLILIYFRVWGSSAP